MWRDDNRQEVVVSKSKYPDAVLERLGLKEILNRKPKVSVSVSGLNVLFY